MSAGTYNITIEQNTTWSRTVTWTDSTGALVNLTGYTANMRVNATTPLDLSSPASGIVLGGAAGTIAITITAAQATALAAGTWTYDLKLTSGSGAVTRLIAGTAAVTATVTP